MRHTGTQLRSDTKTGVSRSFTLTDTLINTNCLQVHKDVWNAPPMMLMLEGAVVDVGGPPFDVDLVDPFAPLEPCGDASTICTGIVSVLPPTSSQVT